MFLQNKTQKLTYPTPTFNQNSWTGTTSVTFENPRLTCPPFPPPPLLYGAMLVNDGTENTHGQPYFSDQKYLQLLAYIYIRNAAQAVSALYIITFALIMPAPVV